MLWKDASTTYFFYDAMLRRYALNQNGTVNYFLWDGPNLLQELSAAGAVQEETASGRTVAAQIGFKAIGRPPKSFLRWSDPRSGFLGNTAYFTYDGASKLTQRLFDDGIRRDASYVAADRLSRSIYSKSNNAPVTYFDYTRDPKDIVTKAVGQAIYTQYFT